MSRVIRKATRRATRPIFVAALLLAAITNASSGLDTDVRALTFNIRYGTAEDGPNHWSLRRERVFETLRAEDYDFIGLQEALPFQIDEIAAALPGHGVLYRTREVDPAVGEACAILYRRDRWDLDRRRQGTFWLSETPAVEGSKSWDSSLPRIATWGVFQHAESAARIAVINTHFDHRGQSARENSAALLRAKIPELADDSPFLLMGDFNAGEQNAAIVTLRGAPGSDDVWIDSYRKLHPEEKNAFTGNGWGERTSGEKIDAIFVDEDAEILEAEILRPRHEGRAPSDHDPVSAVLRLRVAEYSVEITDLGECRSCAGATVKALARVGGALAAELHSTDPRILVAVDGAAYLDESSLREAVRNTGYTPGAIERTPPN